MNVQIFSSCPVEKGVLLKEERSIVTKISHNEEGTITSWCFSEECLKWYPRMTPTHNTSLYLKNISSLCREGAYSFELKQWKRLYLTLDGVVINLVEDIPESGGFYLLSFTQLN